MGLPLKLKRPEFANMRKWRVQDFESFLNLLSALPRRHLRGPRALRGARLVESAGNGVNAHHAALRMEAIDTRAPPPGKLAVWLLEFDTNIAPF